MIKSVLFAMTATAAALMAASAPASAGQDLSDTGSRLMTLDNPENWQGTILRTERGHLIGNPKADAQLIEFISYTCPHCADFTARGEPALELALLMPGKMSLEVRPVIRNALDLTVTLLAQCGDPDGFKGRHQALMLSQGEWLGKAQGSPVSQRAIWSRGDKASRMNVASALGLTRLLADRGQAQVELDACVSNDAAARALVNNGRADFEEFGVQGTPSFALDGKLLEGAHNWDSLYPALSARFAATPAVSLEQAD
ncbi:DsbA family protein [Erythrobacter sp. R86502]|uniref:DsbA family protein n=1 Tax=Erythrobacter sp. R86502 TaxID=3093846 RepID=UPI0036D3A4C9